MEAPAVGAALLLLAAAFSPAASGAAAAGDPAPAPEPIPVRIPALARGIDGPAPFTTPEGFQGFVAATGNGSAGFPAGDLDSSLAEALRPFLTPPTPAVEGRRVFTGTGTEMRAIDALDGRLLWKAPVDDTMPTAPAVREGRVYFNTESCTLYALEASTGKRLWSRWIADSVLTTPAVSEDGVFVSVPAGVGTAAMDGGRLEGYSLARGKRTFRTDLRTDLLFAPVISGRRIFLALADGVVAAADLRGRILWERSANALAAPWPHGDRLLVAARAADGGTRLLVLDAASGDPVGGPAGTAPDRTRRRPTGAGRRPADGFDPLDPLLALHGRWLRFGHEGPRPCVAGESAAMNDDRHLRVLSLDGAPRRMVDLRGFPAGAPVAAGDLFLQATTDGRLLGVDAASGDLRFEMVFLRPGGAVSFSSSPAVSRGRAYIGTGEGTLVAVDLPEAAADGWPMWGGGPGRAR